MPDLRKMLKEDIILLDGATGTSLQKAGMPSGICPEIWILEHEEILLKLQEAYVEAGTQILYAPTFSANAFKLNEYGVGDRLAEINQRLIALTRRAAGEKCLVAGDLTMTGRSLAPMGDLEFEELVDCYKEQVLAIQKAGVDVIVIETIMSIQEARAAVLAVKETTALPVFVTITMDAKPRIHEDNVRTLYGTDPVTALVTMEALGVDAFGINCSCGPDTLVPLVREMAEYATVPLIVKPNAGLPELVDGQTLFRMPKEEFAAHTKELVQVGATIIGGCCGTDPSYIKALWEVVRPMPRKAQTTVKKRSILTSERGRVEISLDGPFRIVGERINPTGKKKLQAELLQGSLELVSEMAIEQKRQGASILDINVGMGGIDEAAKMLEVMEKVNQVVETPLCMDSSSSKVVEAALRRYPGRALVNSISCEKEKIEDLLPVVKKYGAMFILLPLTNEGMPENFRQRWDNIQFVLGKALALGFTKEDIIVDGLVAAAGAEPKAAAHTLATIEACYKNGLATICGLSNISFGLPERAYVNSVFLGMAISRGLTMAIANPSQELFVRSSFAADLLMGKEHAAVRYVENCAYFAKKADELSGLKEQGVTENRDLQEDKRASIKEQVYVDVLKGKEKQIESNLEEALRLGCEAKELLNQVLIPSISKVGEYFNQQKYFLPQLIISAKTMEKGVGVLEPLLLEKQERDKCAVVVIATVKGDIHDIGKNLVAMMMRNHGISVVDLGKDVGKEEMIAAAKAHNADIIAMSALMTTTMSYMQEVIVYAKETGLQAKIIVGGAAVTAGYAKEIGADGYSKDAVEAVELVKEFTQKA